MKKTRFGPRVTDEEDKILKELLAEYRGVKKVAIETSTPIEDIDFYWDKSKKYSVNIKNRFYKPRLTEKLDDVSEQQWHDKVKRALEKELKRTYKPVESDHNTDVEGVLKISDLHYGAHIQDLILTPDYDADILERKLYKAAQSFNMIGFKKAHVHINGDLIESFTGMNHVNSWQSIDKNLIGSKAIMGCVKMLDRVLSKIDNLGEIKIVAGNHDRTTSSNKEDVKGGAAELIAWGLSLKGYSVEFNPMVTTQLVDGINHINLHGHLGISKQPTEKIIWNYGIKGVFNYVFEGHLHSVIKKLSVKQRDAFKILKDDSLDFRRMHLASFFTGNFYSESLGYTANAGYSIIYDNGEGLPMEINATI